MKLLIVPDIHNHTGHVERLISSFPGYHAVFLGDYFDNYHDTPALAGETAEWLRYSIHQPNRTHLMGNHDLPYRWRHFTCPGFTAEKYVAIWRKMRKEDWDRVSFHLTIWPKQDARPMVFSHAGFTLANLYGVEDYRDVASGGRLAFLRNRLASEYISDIHTKGREALQAAEERRDHYWFNQGTRVGHRNVGGPFWIDRHEVRSPLPGVDQIVGHTNVHTPQCHYVPNKAAPNCTVRFIDGAGKYAALVNTNETEAGGVKVTVINARGPNFGQPIE